MYVDLYMYIHMCIHIRIYIYIQIYRSKCFGCSGKESSQTVDTKLIPKQLKRLCICMYVYVYMCINIHVCIDIRKK
jgi:hypothetical protein